MSKEIEFGVDGMASSDFEQSVLRMKAAPLDADLYAELVAGMSFRQKRCFSARRHREIRKLDRKQAKAGVLADRLEAQRARQELASLRRRSGRKDAFAGRDVVQDLALKHPGDIRTQLMAFLSIPRMAAMGTRRQVSERTQTEYKRSLLLFFKYLEGRCLLPSNLKELGRVHVIHAVKLGAARGFSNAYMQNFISRLRRFFDWMGKSDVVPTTAQIEELLGMSGADGKSVRCFKRDKIARQPHSWQANGVDFEQIHAKVSERCPHTAMLLELQAAFGLRVKESLMLRPRHTLNNGHLHVVHGTKGGRARAVPLSSDPQTKNWQLDVLARATAFADQKRGGDMGYTDRTLRTSINRYYYILKKAGVTHEELGVTSHGLRHMYVSRRYQDLVGSTPPVEGLSEPVTAELKGKDLMARLIISEELGHSRATITQAYSGSVTQLDREQKKVFNLVIQNTEKNPAFQRVLAEFDVRRCWVAGSLGAGLKPRKGEALHLLLEFAPASTWVFDAQSTQALSNALTCAVQAPVLFSLHPFGMEPGDRVLEIYRVEQVNRADQSAQTAKGVAMGGSNTHAQEGEDLAHASIPDQAIEFQSEFDPAHAADLGMASAGQEVPGAANVPRSDKGA